MENYSYNSYPESGNSSPRSREIDFENPPPWDDQQPPPNYKVKFMCSYGGKIHPRPHDNQLSYIGGETKILAVDRNIRFSSLVAKLSSQCEADVCFKYQLPGEDLDALISVTNDDDLEHMMTEYDRLYRASAKPARLRLFLFPVNQSPVASTTQSIGSTEGKLDKEHFLEALNSGPIHPAPPPHPPPSATVQPPSKVDFLFGLEREMPPTMAANVRDAITDPAISGSEVPIHRIDDRDPIQKHIQDLQRLHIAEQQAMYQRKNDEHIAPAFTGGEYYVQKVPEKVAPPTSLPGTTPIPYIPERQISGGQFPPTTFVSDQQVYMIPAPSGMYQAPMARQMTGVAGPTGQGYYGMQRMPHEVYRDQPVYNMMPHAQQAPPPQQPPRTVAAYSEGFGMVRPGGMGVAETGYAQMAYDSNTGRHVYYNAKGAQQAPPAQYQAMGGAPAGYNADMRHGGGFNQEGGKVVTGNVSQPSM